MKTINTIYTTPEKHFTVTKKDVNNYQTLLPNVLYEEIESFINSIITNYPEIIGNAPQLYKLELIRNAYLNDKLLFKVQIKRFNGLELHLQAIVTKKNLKRDLVIGKALFKFPLKKSFSKAS